MEKSRRVKGNEERKRSPENFSGRWPTSLCCCCLGADKSCPVSLEGDSCRPEESPQPPAAAAASSCWRLLPAEWTGGELADEAVVAVVAADEVGGGGGGGEASGSAE